MLIEYKFDFKKLINIFDSIKNETGLLVLCKYNHGYSNVKLLIQHCANLKDISSNIMQCDTIGRNALNRSAISDIITLAFLLQNLYFPNVNDLQSTEYGVQAFKNKIQVEIQLHMLLQPNPNVKK